MIGDLIKLYEAVQAAADKHTEQQRQEELNKQVQAEIEKLFEPDARWPKGQRRFDVISKSLGIFNDRPDELRQFLFGMGGRPKTSSDGEELWELERSKSDESVKSEAEAPSNAWWKWLGSIIALVAGLVAILEFFGLTGSGIASLIVQETLAIDILKRK